MQKGIIMHETMIEQILKNRREMLKVSQQTLAQISGVGLRTIKQIERGKGNPNLQTLQKLSDALGLEVILQVKKAPFSI